MNTAKAIASYRRLRGAAAWRLLAADTAPAILALLQSHLLDENRSLGASVLFERIGRDLEALRGDGEDMPRTAQAYVSDWLSAGYLSRRFPPGAAEEEYELTAAAAGAIRFATGLIDRHATATESRLSTVIQQLARLADETESDPAVRIAALEAERERIDIEIEAVRQGRVRTLPGDRALERVREIIALAGELAADFRRVRDEFDQLNRELRERIMDNDGSRGETLEALFAGVDVIADSDAGRTFYAFWRLLTDPEQGATLEEALDRVLGREFAARMEVRERRFLLRLIQSLLEQGGLVHEVLQHFARSLKQFVQSREYLEQRRMNQLLKEAQRAALAIKESVPAGAPLEYDLPLTSSRIRSIDQWVLHDPSLHTIEKGVHPGDTALIGLDSIGEWVAQSEIDFRSLEGNIRAALEERSPVSIGEILVRFPAAQGLGSVVGYLALGSRHGVPAPGHTEAVTWRAADGTWRGARIPKVYFVEENFHVSG